MLSYSIGVVCARIVVNLSLTFSCIGRLLGRFGILFSASLVFNELCHLGFWSFYLAGVMDAVVSGLIRFGI
jgi:hypothetical protein